MENKMTLQETSIKEIAKAFALADFAARTPREFNPHIPMVKDELYKLSFESTSAGTSPTRSKYVFFAGVNGSGKTSFIRCMKNTDAFLKGFSILMANIFILTHFIRYLINI